MRRLLVFFILLASLAGCSRVHDVDPTAQGNALSELNQSLRGRQIAIHMRDGSTRVGDGVYVRPDTTFWYEQGAVSRRSSAPTSVIAQLSFRDLRDPIGRFARYGLIGGGGAGCAVGLAAALSISSDYVISSTLLGGGIGAAVAGSVAVLTALVATPEERFVFPGGEAAPRTE